MFTILREAQRNIAITNIQSWLHIARYSLVKIFSNDVSRHCLNQLSHGCCMGVTWVLVHFTESIVSQNIPLQ